MRKSEEAVARRTEAYRKLMATTRKVMGQAKLFSHEVAAGVKQASTLRGQLLIQGLAIYLEEMHGLTVRVLKQTKARVLAGNQHYTDKLYSVFEVHRGDPQGKAFEAYGVWQARKDPGGGASDHYGL